MSNLYRLLKFIVKNKFFIFKISFILFLFGLLIFEFLWPLNVDPFTSHLRSKHRFFFKLYIETFNSLKWWYDTNFFFLVETFMYEYSLIMSIKLILCLTLLILIRGGVARYRYDVLSKLGWIKLFACIVFILIIVLILFLK